MATEELRELRHLYKEAYTTYMNCVQALSDASQKGEWPPSEVRASEERAISELNARRQALLDAMYSHSRRTSK